ncbi:hypothetical protein BDZ89DRAFT_1064621 [Hymenopellis radicata]|nr:hypothetical protein BDZ89DRAFT_1064621 [Hymenopellis radicata]
MLWQRMGCEGRRSSYWPLVDLPASPEDGISSNKRPGIARQSPTDDLFMPQERYQLTLSLRPIARHFPPFVFLLHLGLFLFCFLICARTTYSALSGTNFYDI